MTRLIIESITANILLAFIASPFRFNDVPFLYLMSSANAERLSVAI